MSWPVLYECYQVRRAGVQYHCKDAAKAEGGHGTYKLPQPAALRGEPNLQPRPVSSLLSQ